MARSSHLPHLPRRPHRRGRIVLACAVAALPLTIACNSIIGLTDFDKGECPGARCGDGGAFPDVLIDGFVPDVTTDAPIDAKGADPVSWAKWPMPYYGEAGAGLPPTALPLVVAGDTVTDPTTKLVWRNAIVQGDFRASDADVECKKITASGPWRAPKRIELVTLLDYDRAPPLIDTTKFTGNFGFKIWTTSEVRPVLDDKSQQAYWVVDFISGSVKPLAGSGAETAKVLCVRDK